MTCFCASLYARAKGKSNHYQTEGREQLMLCAVPFHILCRDTNAGVSEKHSVRSRRHETQAGSGLGSQKTKVWTAALPHLPSDHFLRLDFSSWVLCARRVRSSDWTRATRRIDTNGRSDCLAALRACSSTHVAHSSYSDDTGYITARIFDLAGVCNDWARLETTSFA